VLPRDIAIFPDAFRLPIPTSGVPRISALDRIFSSMLTKKWQVLLARSRWYISLSLSLPPRRTLAVQSTQSRNENDTISHNVNRYRYTDAWHSVILCDITVITGMTGSLDAYDASAITLPSTNEKNYRQ